MFNGLNGWRDKAPVGLEPGHEGKLDEVTEGYFWEASYDKQRGTVELSAMAIRRRTPKGCHYARCHGPPNPSQIMFGSGGWVAYSSRRFCPTRRAALEHFLAKKRSHVRHATRRLKEATNALKAVETALGQAPEDMPDWVERRVWKYTKFAGSATIEQAGLAYLWRVERVTDPDCAPIVYGSGRTSSFRLAIGEVILAAGEQDYERDAARTVSSY